MNRPPVATIDAVAPPHDVGLRISDLYSVRNVAHSEAHNTMRLARGGPHEATLVAMKKYYDGSAGGRAGTYVLAFIEFRATKSRWRTAGVKIRQEEALRIARDVVARKSSKPGRKEEGRVGGGTIATDESILRGEPVDGGYVVFVQHRHRSGDIMRTGGVEIRTDEAPLFARMLKQLAETPEVT